MRRLHTKRSLGYFELFIGKIEIESIRTRHIEKYMAWRKQPHDSCRGKNVVENRIVANRTVNKDLTYVFQAFAKAKQWQFIKDNPCEGLKKMADADKNRVRFFSEQEIELVFSTANNYIERFFRFGINTGLRAGEILNLRLEDIDIKNSVIHIRNRKDFKTKNRKDRDVPIMASFKPYLEKYIQTWVDCRKKKVEKRKPEQMTYLFCKEDGKRILSLKKAFGTFMGKAKLENVCIHTMRHTFASHLVMSGVNLKVIQEVLGHSSISVTERYSHLSPQHRHQAVANLSLFEKKKENPTPEPSNPAPSQPSAKIFMFPETKSTQFNPIETVTCMSPR